ncbi:MAG: RNA polymerase sigma factor [Sandaracinaceae bacterium]|nr:RNA polymerase sigma factor [Sandaracinaceae bacterium]
MTFVPDAALTLPLAERTLSPAAPFVPQWLTASLTPAYSERRRVGIEDSLEARLASGDRRALEALLREHGRAIHDLCRFVAGFEDGGDATQEALERIVTNIHSFDPARGSFRTWALTVARNVCRDRLRRRGLERKTFTRDGDEQTSWAPSEAPSPERVALARIETDRLHEALETLPEPMRLAVVLYHVHEATYEEIAQTLEVPIGTVMTWLHRGRKRLRAALDPEAAG